MKKQQPSHLVITCNPQKRIDYMYDFAFLPETQLSLERLKRGGFTLVSKGKKQARS